MSDKIDAKHLLEQSREAVEEVLPLESDRLYQAPPAGSSASGDDDARHDDVLYRYSSPPRI